LIYIKTIWNDAPVQHVSKIRCRPGAMVGNRTDSAPQTGFNPAFDHQAALITSSPPCSAGFCGWPMEVTAPNTRGTPQKAPRGNTGISLTEPSAN